jgi:predicted acetyltransferase
MKVTLESASNKNKRALRSLVKMYCYEWSQYNGIDIDENGDFAFERDVDKFFTADEHYAYLIRADGKIAGFVLVDTDIDYYKDSDHAISEFFVLYKYRRSGVGKQAAKEAFERHKGGWEIKMHPKNGVSIEFWKRVVAETAKGGTYAMKEGCEEARYHDGALGTFIGFETAE